MAKRTFDITIGLLLALATVPFIAVAALALALTYRCSPFFSQVRVGKDGRHFRFIKLRTLPPTTPAYADKYAIASVELPWIANLLRRSHLDELPQLWLVVAGQMSLVGPRPEMPNLHAEMEPGFAHARTSVRPGVTGLWQISDRCDRLIAETPELDLAYLRRSGLGMDLGIIARTVLIAFGLAGPVPASSVLAPARVHAPAAEARLSAEVAQAA